MVIIVTQGLQEKSHISSLPEDLQVTFNNLLNQKRNPYTPKAFPEGQYTSIVFAADDAYDIFVRISDNVTRTFGKAENAGISQNNNFPVTKNEEIIMITARDTVQIVFSFYQVVEMIPSSNPTYDALEIDVGWDGYNSINGVPGLPLTWVGNNSLVAYVNCTGYFIDRLSNAYPTSCTEEDIEDGMYTFTSAYQDGLNGLDIILVALVIEIAENTVPNPTTGTTGNPTTQNPTTQNPTTANPTTTENPTTENPTTANPTTAAPTTANPTTANPTTADPTTADPTTADPTTANPTTANPTTANPTTANPTTANPTTASPTTANPTTASPTTANPTTASPTTANPTTASPTTASPTTANPTTKSPTTASPTTAAPTTANPTTASPTTQNPTTDNPTTSAEDKVNSDSSRTVVSLTLMLALSLFLCF